MYVFYVYAYLDYSGKPYYIGKGTGARAWTKHRNTGIPRDKSKIVILESNLSDIGACALERRMIRWYGRKDLGTGILINKTEGGDGGNFGKKFSTETKEKMRLAKLGKNNPNFQKQFSEATRAKLRAKAAEREAKKKESKSQYGP